MDKMAADAGTDNKQGDSKCLGDWFIICHFFRFGECLGTD